MRDLGGPQGGLPLSGVFQEGAASGPSAPHSAEQRTCLASLANLEDEIRCRTPGP